MLDWLRTLKVFEYLSFHVDVLGYVTSLPLAIFLLVSPRINARLEAAAPNTRYLQRLAHALSIEKSNNLQKIKKGLIWLLKKVDWLFHEKLKLLPSVHTGRRVNFFLLFLAAFIVSVTTDWVIFGGSKTYETNLAARQAEMALAMDVRSELWASFFLLLLSGMLIALPFFLVRKNREFYFDVLALFLLCWIAFDKLVNCWYWGCCFGIPWSRGFYNEIIETTVFPIQVLEFAVGFVLTIACVLYMLYAKTYRPGYGCTFCLLSYAIPRFFWDYLRYLGEGYRSVEINGIFGLTMVQVVCVIGVVIGIAWLFVLPLEKKLLDRF